ncbi:hypothetical protein BDV96DRAFT_601202 [Lophiotrema nucula]|uniref:Ferric oxidoreductase domain-containing protein n=1 Tax=Lophiotrema nucula TaxID=690887 RepID=A0A6A5Z2R7_9PLEO|nr:hypothetical protein BDV96DRAFT_601202 [Lophiotrema nucula]
MDAAGHHRHTQIDFGAVLNLAEPPPPPPPPSTPRPVHKPSRRAIPKNGISIPSESSTSHATHIPANPPTGLMSYTLVEANNAHVRAHEYVRSTSISPWQSYKELYKLRLDLENWVMVVEKKKSVNYSTQSRRDPFANLGLIRAIRGPDVEEKLEMLKAIQHKGFLLPLQIFRQGRLAHVSHDYMATPLSNLAGNPLLDELQVAAILGQLNDPASPEWKREDQYTSEGKTHIRALSFILMELMQGYEKNGGLVGVVEPDRWSADALSFLSETTSATSAAELLECLLHVLRLVLATSYRHERVKSPKRGLNRWSTFLVSKGPFFGTAGLADPYSSDKLLKFLAYAVAYGGFFMLLVCLAYRSQIARFSNSVRVLVTQHLVYPPIVHRHQHIGPWSRANVLLQLIYAGISCLCLTYKAKDIPSVGLRAARISLINLIPAFANPHLGSAADICGVPLKTFRKIHKSAGYMSSIFLAIHCLVIVAGRIPFPARTQENMWAIIATSMLGTICLLSHRIARRASYEIFIRVHQALAVVSAYSIWRHLKLASFWPKLYVSIFASLFVLSLVIQLLVFIWKNRPEGDMYPYTTVKAVNNTVKLSLKLPRPVKAEGEQTVLDLIIEPRDGFTRTLLEYSNSHPDKPCLAFYSGPHRQSAPVQDFETVIMVASGFGIIAHLPYLKWLIYRHNAHKGRTRRAHLVWKMERNDMEFTLQNMQDLLNEALDDDRKSQILSMTFYMDSAILDEHPFGDRARVLGAKKLDLQAIVEEERGGKQIKRLESEPKGQGDTLVIGSLRKRPFAGHFEGGRA